jgi:hypothetical protein
MKTYQHFIEDVVDKYTIKGIHRDGVPKLCEELDIDFREMFDYFLKKYKQEQFVKCSDCPKQNVFFFKEHIIEFINTKK